MMMGGPPSSQCDTEQQAAHHRGRSNGSWLPCLLVRCFFWGSTCVSGASGGPRSLQEPAPFLSFLAASGTAQIDGRSLSAQIRARWNATASVDFAALAVAGSLNTSVLMGTVYNLTWFQTNPFFGARHPSCSVNLSHAAELRARTGVWLDRALQVKFRWSGENNASRDIQEGLIKANAANNSYSWPAHSNPWFVSTGECNVKTEAQPTPTMLVPQPETEPNEAPFVRLLGMTQALNNPAPIARYQTPHLI